MMKHPVLSDDDIVNSFNSKIIIENSNKAIDDKKDCKC